MFFHQKKGEGDLGEITGLMVLFRAVLSNQTFCHRSLGRSMEIVQRLELGKQSQLHTYLKRQANLTLTLTQD